MIRLEVEDYCQSCMDFSPDVTRPTKYYAGRDEIVLGDTVVRCEYRKRCSRQVWYLEQQMKNKEEKDDLPRETERTESAV